MCAGAVKRVGRCDAYATEFDLEAEEYVPLPKVSFSKAAFAFLQPSQLAAHDIRVMHVQLCRILCCG